MEKKVKVVRLSDRWKKIITDQIKAQSEGKDVKEVDDLIAKVTKESDNVSYDIIRLVTNKLARFDNVNDSVRMQMITQKFEKVINDHVIMKEDDVSLFIGACNKILKDYAEVKADRPIFALFEGNLSEQFNTVMEQFLYAEPVKG